MRPEHESDRHQLDPFRAVSGDIAIRDLQVLMAWPFFSLAKSKRLQPIDFRMGDVAIKVEAAPGHGMATIWDADILIWAASQITEARDAGRPTSPLIRATRHHILSFIARGVSVRDYERLKAALDRLRSTTVTTSIGVSPDRHGRFAWISDWGAHLDTGGRPTGIELRLADWFYSGVLDQARVLTIDRGYFGLKGGIERWLYRIARKYGGHQPSGWSFDVHHLHKKSGALSSRHRFAFELRRIVRRQPLPGYRLSLDAFGNRQRLHFEPVPVDPFEAAMRRVGLKLEDGRR